MNAAQFVGTWKLVTLGFRRSDGTITYPYQADALGMLMHDAVGNMSVQIMRANRPHFPSGDPARGTAEDMQKAFDGVVTYFGRYDVDHAAVIVTHHVLGSSFPN